MSSWAKSEGNSAEVAKRVAFKHETMLKQAAQEAAHIFSDPVVVEEADRLHGLAGILEQKLREADIINSSTPASKKNRLILFLEQELEGLGAEKLRELGFESGTIKLIRAGEKLDLSILDEAGWAQAIR